MTADGQAGPDPRAWESWAAPPGVPDTATLAWLAADAAARADALLTGGTAGADDPLADAVRMLATVDGAPRVTRAAEITGIPEEELRRLVLAFRHGGAGGVAAARGATPCGAADLGAALAEVRARRPLAVGDLASGPGEITDTRAGIRLRLGPDGRWHPFTLAREKWWPAAGANASAGAAYQAAARARARR